LAVADAIRDVPSHHHLGKFGLIPWLGLEEDLPRLVGDVGANGLTVERFLATDKLCAVAEQLGIPVIAWVVNSEREARRLAKSGVQGFTTDNPAVIGAIAKPKVNPTVHPGLVA
jgi:glycerophosphoryl diester phosphodiesterase